MPCNINGFKNRPFIIVNNPNDVISSEMKYIAIEEYSRYVDRSTGTLSRDYGNKLRRTGCAFDTINEHSETSGRVYFIDTALLKSKWIVPLTPTPARELESALWYVSNKAIKLIDLKFLFKHFVYVSDTENNNIGFRYDFEARTTIIFRANLKMGYLEEVLETFSDEDYPLMMEYIGNRTPHVK